ncbi:MAG TPA: hypothetical protein DCF63_02855, partial [Planctomycetaceae bacterium]|nr:hypothetical protein [Planctomycetaceae bacterium]
MSESIWALWVGYGSRIASVPSEHSLQNSIDSRVADARVFTMKTLVPNLLNPQILHVAKSFWDWRMLW